MKRYSMVLCILSIAFFVFASCSSGGGDPAEDFWGHEENGNLSLSIKKSMLDEYGFMLSQNGNVYVTVDGTEPSDSNYDYHFEYDYSQGVSYSYTKLKLYDVWEARIRAIAVADGYPTVSENGHTIIYDPPVAPEGTTVVFDRSIRLTERSVSSSSTVSGATPLDIPEWASVSCSGYWGDVLGREEYYYVMEAGSSGTLRYVRNATNTGTFGAYYMDDSPVTDGDTITSGTQFYLHAKQGDTWSTNPSVTRYSFDFWVEE